MLNEENLQVEYKVVNNRLGAISILKVDGSDNSKVLAGVEFELRDSLDNLIETLFTDEDGKAKVEGLLLGEYTLVETKAPKGYAIDGINHKIVLNEENLQVDYKVVNNRPGVISILKVDGGDSSKVLAGAEFELRDAEDNLLKTLITGDDGTAKVDELLLGEYTLVETKAPKGYVVDGIKHKIVLNEENLQVEYKVVNNGPGAISVLKVDGSDSSKVLAGAEFELMDSLGNLIGTLVTGEDGTAKLEGLLLGEYTLVETKAPTGYKLNSMAATVTLEETSMVSELTIKNDKEEDPSSGVENESESGNTGTDNEATSPDTGDSMKIEIYLGIMLLAIMGIVVLIKTRKSN